MRSISMIVHFALVTELAAQMWAMPAAVAPAYNMPVPQHFQTMRAPPMQQFGQPLGNAPSVQYVVEAQSQNPVRGIARKKGTVALKKIDPAQLKERTPGSDTLNAEEDDITVGLYGKEGKKIPAKGSFYGPKMGATGQKGRASGAKPALLSDTSDDAVSIPLVLLISFLVGSGVTFAAVKLRIVSMSRGDEPLLATSA
jgi:hypothetical protein